uniref:DUF3456 domain-containing protein n=1 Tax=Glossina palpalis gambiensis TaxID=67801 RepID=A0A1B0ALU0_9MUSC
MVTALRKNKEYDTQTVVRLVKYWQTNYKIDFKKQEDPMTFLNWDDVKPKRRTEYKRSELRLLESMEDVCQRMLNYNLHKERSDSTRFAKGMSQTFKTLHGLVEKGVKVELGIPYELWDKPPVEVTQMKTQCENMLEQYEDAISDWYFNKQDVKDLITHLCAEQVLSAEESNCLKEADDNNAKEFNKKKAKHKANNVKGDNEEL